MASEREAVSAGNPGARNPRLMDLSLGEALRALAGPLVWSVHFLLVYFAVEAACRLGLLGGQLLGLTWLGWLLVVATLLAVALIAWAGWRSYQRWRSLRTGAGPDLALRPADLLALAGWVLGLVFLVLVVLSVVPTVVLRPCSWG